MSAAIHMDVTKYRFAKELGVSRATIDRAIENGRIKVLGNGKIDLQSQKKAFVDNRDISKCRNTEDDPDEKASADYGIERTLLTKAQREKAELELSVMRGELHHAEDVEAVMNTMVSSFRTRILSIPTKAAGELLNKTTLAEVKEILTKFMYEALNELADYNAETYNNKARSAKRKVITESAKEDI